MSTHSANLLLITEDGRFDLGAIMRKAHRLASYHHARDPFASRSALFQRWLADVWIEAHRAMDRFRFRRDGNPLHEIFFATMRAAFSGAAPSPAGLILVHARESAARSE